MGPATKYIGIDLGRNTSAGIIEIRNQKPVFVDALKTNLARGIPEKAKADKKMAFRIERLYNFLENLLDTFPEYVIGIERPPQMKGKIAVGHLQGYFGVALLMARRSEHRFETFAVTQWRGMIDANRVFESKTKASTRAKLVKQRVKEVILEHLDVETDHDRADGLGIALATAITKGGLVL